jgi:hypothetical protein
MPDTRTISQLEAEGYPWIGCECCKGTVWVPCRMIRETIPALSSWTLDELGAKMKCDQCGRRPERYYPARQGDAPGFQLRRLLNRQIGRVGSLEYLINVSRDPTKLDRETRSV